MQLMEDGENGASGLNVQLHAEMALKADKGFATILHQTMGVWIAQGMRQIIQFVQWINVEVNI